jgi:uncharacterized protein YecT (DUF1311 family)
MLEKMVLMVVGSALTGVGLLVLRWLKKDRLSEDLTRRKQAADLVAHIRDIGVRMEDVDAVLSSIGRKRGDRIGQHSPKAITAQDQEDAREIAALENAESQYELNRLQQERGQRLNRRMLAAYKALLFKTEEPAAHQLQAEQDAWLHYRDLHREFAGAYWEGGSLQPFMRWGAYSHLTKERAALLENELSAYADG